MNKVTESIVYSFSIVLLLLCIYEPPHTLATSPHIPVPVDTADCIGYPQHPLTLRHDDTHEGALQGLSLLTQEPRCICEDDVRLGNKLFELPAAIYCARLLNRTLVFYDCDFMTELSEMFPNVALFPRIPIQTIDEEFEWVKLDKHVESPYQFYNVFDSIEQNAPLNYSIQSYFQNWRYSYSGSKCMREAIKFMYDLSPKHKLYVHRVLHRAKTSTSQRKVTYVAVHVRRGDLNSQFWLQHGLSSTPISFFVKAMIYMVHRFNTENTIFVIGSDSMAAVKNEFRALNYTRRFNMVYLEGNAMEDFSVLSSCNHSIISGGSTFGYWTAYLADGLTVYNPEFPQPYSYIDFSYRPNLFYPPHWIPMSVVPYSN